MLCVGPAGEAAGAGAGYTQTTSPADPSTVVTGASTKEKLIYARSPTPKTSTLSAVEGVCGTPTPGTSTPLGAHVDANAVNFAVHAHSQVRSVSLLLFTRDTLKQNSINGGLPVAELELDAASHRTGSVWHVRLDNLAPGLLYAWRIVGPTKEDIFPTTAASPNLPVSDAVAAAAAPSTPQTTTDPATGAPVVKERYSETGRAPKFSRAARFDKGVHGGLNYVSLVWPARRPEPKTPACSLIPTYLHASILAFFCALCIPCYPHASSGRAPMAAVASAAQCSCCIHPSLHARLLPCLHRGLRAGIDACDSHAGNGGASARPAAGTLCCHAQ